MKPGPRDIKVLLRIDGEELVQLKRQTWQMAEAFGLDSRIERYEGKRPIALYRWDMDCLIDVITIALDDQNEHPSRDTPDRQALKSLLSRLQAEYRKAFD